MLPGIDHEDRDAALGHLGLMIVNLIGGQTPSHRVPDESPPPRAHDARGRLDELLLHEVEGPEVSSDRDRENAVRLSASFRRKVLPEHRVQHVA